MARTSKKQLLEFYRSELDRARNFRQTEGYDDLWLRMIDLYRGRCLPMVHNVEDRIVVNIAFGTINVIYPSVSVNYPKITVMPTHPLDEERAVVVEAVTNYEWKHRKYQDQVRLAIKDFLIVGHGWVKTTYKYKEQQVAAGPQDQESQFEDLTNQADQFAAQNPHLAGYVPDDAEIMGNLPQTKTVVAEDYPCIERISPFDVYVDPEATNMQDVRWICQRIIRPLTEVQKDPRYKPGARSRVKGDMSVDRRLEEQHRGVFRRQGTDPDDQRVTVWEWYDVKSNTMAAVAEGGDDFLIDPTPCPFAFGHPFTMIRNYDVPEFFYPMGDLEAIEPLVNELNKTRSISIGVRKKFARKYLYRQGAFDAAGRQALQSDVDNTLIPVADENSPFAEVLAAMPQVPVPPELFQHSEEVEKDIGDVSGISDYQRGQVPETRRTATEASIISDAVNARAADKLATVEGFMADVARHVVQLMQQFMSQVQVARVVGPDQAIFWVPYDREDIEGEYDFEVEAGSTQPMNETQRRQTATALMQTLAPFIGTVIDPAAMAQHVLKFGFGIQNPAKFLMMQPPPQPGMPGQEPGQEPGMEPGGVGGMQPAPMGGGYADGQTGEMGNSMPGGAMEGY